MSNNNDKHHAVHHRRLRRLRGAMADSAGVAVVCGVVHGDCRMIARRRYHHYLTSLRWRIRKTIASVLLLPSR